MRRGEISTRPEAPKTRLLYTRLEDTRLGGLLFLLCWAAYATAYVGRYNYSAVMAAIIEEGSLSLGAAGAVSTGYFVCYAAGQVAAGLLSARLSPYGMIFAGLGLSGLCNLAMAVIPPAAMAAVWACNGLFQAMIWPPIVRLFAEVIPLAQQKRACVSINSTTPAGTLIAYGLSALLLAVSAWQTVFLLCGVLMLAVAAGWLALTLPLRRASAPRPVAPAAPKGPAAKSNGPLKAAVAFGLAWVVLPVGLHGALKDGVATWVPSMIQANFGATAAFSAAISMVLPLVNLAGAYAAGWADRRLFRNELRTAAAMFALAALCLLALPFGVQYSLPVTVLLLALTTAAMLGANTMFIGVIPVRAGRAGGAAAVSGALNAVTYLGAALSTWGIGAVAENAGWTATCLLWLGMAAVAVCVCAALAGRWAAFAPETEGKTDR